jgi:hypothetical protein
MGGPTLGQDCGIGTNAWMTPAAMWESGGFLGRDDDNLLVDSFQI